MADLTLDKIKAVVLGHAVADALGVPVEFRSRRELSEDPVVDMRGYGTYAVPAGAWSDDTSMSLCALESLAKGALDYDDVMRNFGKWYYEGEFTPTGKMFDVGGTCSLAIHNYCKAKKAACECGPDDDRANGNGSLMRIHPFVLYLSDMEKPLPYKLAVIRQASALTHAHPISTVGCGIYACILWALLAAPAKAGVFLGLAQARAAYAEDAGLQAYARLFSDDFSQTGVDDIKSGSYVVSSLEAAVWCLLTTSSYRECVLKAVNLGGDTDTTGAIAGGLAGALYGYGAIPQPWLDTLLRGDYIADMCQRAWRAWART